ncbi:MAG: Gfo/Idh/MocA family oxidoreductase [Armatimonadetes bacterium]|nr:Gfo/Idh/MocA family oxidoreductase [Armatimonadota bacterium]
MKFQQSVAMPKVPRAIIIVGAGGIVRHAHLPAYRLAGFEVAGIFDVNIDSAKSLAAEFNIPRVFDNLKQALGVPGGEVIFDVALPASAVLETLKELPDQSFVLVQKPMGEDLTQARAIRDLCRKKGLRMAVNFQLRTAPYCLIAKQIIADGLIGEILEIDVKVTVQTPWANWTFLEKSPRMEIVYHSIHYIDFIRSLVGNPVGVKANTIIHPASPKLHSSRSAIIMNYGRNQRAQIVTYHAHDFGTEFQESQIRIEGTKGAIVFQMGLNMNYPEGESDFLKYAFKGKVGWMEVPLEGSWFPHAFIGTMASVQRWAEDESLIPGTHFEDAFQTMQVVEACYIDAESPGTALPDGNR